MHPDPASLRVIFAIFSVSSLEIIATETVFAVFIFQKISLRDVFSLRYVFVPLGYQVEHFAIIYGWRGASRD